MGLKLETKKHLSAVRSSIKATEAERAVSRLRLSGFNILREAVSHAVRCQCWRTLHMSCFKVNCAVIYIIAVWGSMLAKEKGDFFNAMHQNTEQVILYYETIWF